MSNYDQLVGDFTNPILKPQTAEIVKKFGDLSLKRNHVSSSRQPMLARTGPLTSTRTSRSRFSSSRDRITIIYEQDHEVRHVRLNEPHPAEVKPSWYGDSVAHYEGDTLVIDTVGTKADRPFAMIDLYGTPYTDKLHVVERYRLVPYEDAKEGLERDTKENQHPPVGIDRSYRGKYLQLYFTVEDDGVFATPWSATITRWDAAPNHWPETVWPENIHEYYNNKELDVPRADKPDF